MNEIIPDVYTWSIFSDEKGYTFNGFAVITTVGTILIDPPLSEDLDWAALDELSPHHAVYITNRNHSREARKFADRYKIPLRIHESDRAQAEAEADEATNTDGSLSTELQILHLPGKSPGEIGFYLPRQKAMIVGDVVIGVPDDELSIYPPEKIDDMDELFRSARKLLDYDFDALLLCDGKSFISGGKSKLEEFLERTPLVSG